MTSGFDPIRSLAGKIAPAQEVVHAAVDLPPLMDWIPTVTAGYAKPTHLAPLVTMLEQMGQRRLRGLSSVPPRHAKSETIIHGLVWNMRRNPEWLWCYLSYGDSLVSAQSRRCRRLAQEAGVELAEDFNSVHDWRTRQGGGLVAQSLMGGVTGRGFKGIIFDDPFKNMEEARSLVIRDKIHDEWNAVAATRLDPNGSALVNATRWHQDDLTGRLQKEPDYERFNMPAIRPGPKGTDIALWPERYSLEQLLQIKREVGPRVWQALYQGDPTDDAGSVFKREWFERPGFVVEPKDVPPMTNLMITVDGAWKTGVGNDYSALEVWGTPFDGSLYYCLDAWRGRVEIPDLLSKIQTYNATHRPHIILVEDAASGIAVIQFFKSTSLPVVPFPVAGGPPKYLRGELVAPIFEAGKVRIVRAPWNAEWKEEHVNFSLSCAHDDWVDCTSMALGRYRQGPVAPPIKHQRSIAVYGR